MQLLFSVFSLALFVIILARSGIWPSIRLIIELNREASEGNPDPEGLKNVYIDLLIRLFGMACLLASIIYAIKHVR